MTKEKIELLDKALDFIVETQEENDYICEQMKILTMTIDEAFSKILERNKNKIPSSASAVEMQAECGASIGDINKRMRERYKAGEIGYFRGINGVRFYDDRIDRR